MVTVAALIYFLLCLFSFLLFPPFFNMHILRISNETDWGLCWEGSYSLSHGTNLSAGVAILFSSNLNTDILSKVKVAFLLLRQKLMNTILYLLIFMPQTEVQIKIQILLKSSIKETE